MQEYLLVVCGFVPLWRIEMTSGVSVLKQWVLWHLTCVREYSNFQLQRTHREVKQWIKWRTQSDRLGRTHR